jgi:acyl-[acyl-carrier-protein] desaturase
MTTTAPPHPRQDALAARFDVIGAVEGSVERQLAMLPSPARAWQPADYLPDLSSDDWLVELGSIRQDAASLPDDLLVVLVGDMVTEEALPSYSMALNRLVRDGEGTSPAPWARWLRGWTAEENRHGDLLNAYLRLSGRVDMGAVERTIHTLLANGFNSGSDGDPYALLVYTAFQERATRISHGNVARLADGHGSPRLARICRVIAGDEARHETFYTRITGEVMAIDPHGVILAVRAMLAGQIVMPGRLMDGDDEPGLFNRFAAVAQRLRVYTAHDYAAITNHLLTTWRIAECSVDGEAARAQDEVCRWAERQMRMADRLAARAARSSATTPHDWLAPLLRR